MERLVEFIRFMIAKGLAESTIEKRIIYYNLFKNHYGDRIDEEAVIEFLTPRNSKPVRAFLKDFLTFNKRKDIEIPKLTGRQPKKIKEKIALEDLMKIRRWLKNNREAKYELLFLLNFFQGLRSIEVLNIKVEDFDLERWLEKRDKRCVLTIKKGKGMKERQVAVEPEIMLKVLERVEERQLNPEEKLFDIGYRRWLNVLKQAAAQSISKKLTTHDLRRAMATIWYEQTKDIISVRDRLGHEDISTTQVYIQKDKEEELEKWLNE